MDLTTTYMGLKLKNPIVPSASPLTQKLENFKKMEDAGAAAVVMFSIFEEQVRAEMEQLDYYLARGTNSFAEALSYFPDMDDFRTGTELYLELIQKAKKAVDIPVIASLNGVSKTGWVEYAQKIEQAGADGLELNVYHIPTDPEIEGSVVDRMYVDVVGAVKAYVKIPVAVKLNPFFSSTANVAKKLVKAGADALVLFNRFYQPDISIGQKKVLSTLKLSESREMLLPLRWIAILYGKFDASLAATTGVHKAVDIVKYIMAGADVTMTTSALMKNGIGHIGTLLKDLEQWMAEHEYASIDELKGSMSQKAVADPTIFERANYVKILEKANAEMTI